jgi:hypothetical protein
MRRIVPILAALALVPALAAAAPPTGWLLSGSDAASYEMQRDTGVTRDGKPSGRLASTRTPKGFGTMMQCVAPTNYLGKRVRLSGYVQSKDVTSWAGLWMRVDGEGSPPRCLAFDNMQNRAIKGSSEWARYEVVLDVPQEATAICFGILLDGPGAVWLSGTRFEVVDTSVPTTSPVYNKKQPENLDFGH